MGLKIVTGRTGTPHVSSNQIQAFNRSLLGDLAILDLGQHFDAVVRDANTVRIYDGCIVVQGIYAIIPHDEFEDILVEPVSVGNTRIDTIYLHYAKDMESDTESVELDIAQGEEAVNNPVKPDIDAGGDTWEGTTDIRIPLYDVTVTSFETTITAYEYMDVYSPNISDLNQRIPETTVSGVKGDAESEYRSGNVNITPANIGLGNVDNTSDTDKPVSTAQQEALDDKVDKVTGKGLSTNDYTNEEKQKNADNASAISDIQEDISQSLTATGNPITIESSESNLVECVAEVEAVQEGSGDPSPDNIRPIIGHTEVAITDNGKTYTIQLGDIIYGGELDVLTGKMVVDKAYKTISEISGWADTTSGNVKRYSTSSLRDMEITGIRSLVGLISNKYETISDDRAFADCPLYCIYNHDEGGVYIHDQRYNSLSDFLTAEADTQIVYPLATPYTIQLTPQQIKLLKGTNNISCNTGDITIKYYPDNVLGQLKGDIESEYDARLERLEQYTDVFGFIEDMDVLSPTERIKYIGKNENYEPLTVDLNTGSYTLGDWGNFPFLVDNKPYMVKPDGTPDYQLNEYDYTKKLDGTDSDVANEDYDGGAFSWGRKIYKKQWMVGNKRYVLFSFDKKDGFHADGFINKDGKELDGRWIPMFYGTVVDGKAKSIATGNCISGGSITTDAQHNAIIAFDSNANFFGGAFVETLIDLLMMFAKNSDLQAAYGYGNSSGYVNDSSKNYGMLNNAVVNGGQFYGRSGGKTLNKALHSIVLATYNSYIRDPYEVIKNGEVVVSEDYTYDPTGATYTDTGITVPNQSSDAWRYPKKYIAVPRYGSIPDISVGGASTSLGRTDGTYTLANQSGAVFVCLRFGDCGCGALAGLSFRAWHRTASFTWWSNGFALLLDGSVVA